VSFLLNLEIGINVAGGKAEILTAQKRGRVQRPWEGSVKKWIDIYDGWTRTTESHSKERLRIYQENGTKVNLINFPQVLKDNLEGGYHAN
jgi:hypothetical protein